MKPAIPYLRTYILFQPKLNTSRDIVRTLPSRPLPTKKCVARSHNTNTQKTQTLTHNQPTCGVRTMLPLQTVPAHCCRCRFDAVRIVKINVADFPRFPRTCTNDTPKHSDRHSHDPHTRTHSTAPHHSSFHIAAEPSERNVCMCAGWLAGRHCSVFHRAAAAAAD